MGQKANIMTFEQPAVGRKEPSPWPFQHSCCQSYSWCEASSPESGICRQTLNFFCVGFKYRFPFLCLPTPLPLQKKSKEFPKHAVEFSQPSRAIITSGLDCGIRECAEAQWLIWALLLHHLVILSIGEITCKLQWAGKTRYWSLSVATDLWREQYRSNGFFSPFDFCCCSPVMSTFSSFTTIHRFVWKKY